MLKKISKIRFLIFVDFVSLVSSQNGSSKRFFFIVVSLKSLCNELESITFHSNKIMVTIKIKEQKLRTHHITKKFELKDYLNESELIDNITKKENEIKQLRNILEISNFSFLMKIPIFTKQVFYNCLNYINNTERSSNFYGYHVFPFYFILYKNVVTKSFLFLLTTLENDKNSPSRQEYKYGASVNFMEIPISTKQAFHDCSNYIYHAEDSSLNQELQVGSSNFYDEELRIYYLKLILELQNCEVLKQFKEPIKLWKTKAEGTFGPFNSVLFLEQSEISPNKNDDDVYLTQTK
ncbi:hypothetical protein F8M41_000970 [Gigaspora margarita]|uniref:Uncharacterized protein n=1 Tax=Gigaspora margarita TaxID=4874 RepID=A0A8H3XF41_GIGMA|nr:hypothetical protein F8M41_000970 [Gigaspora margarita]